MKIPSLFVFCMIALLSTGCDGCEPKVESVKPLSVNQKIGNRDCTIHIIYINGQHNMKVLECDKQLYPAAQEIHQQTNMVGKTPVTTTDVVDTVVLPQASASSSSTKPILPSKDKQDKNCKVVDDNYVLCKR
jgi:hypothetical protein